jgi:hypothetical protein
MTITTSNGFVTSGSTFADVIKDSQSDTKWYKIWDEKQGGPYSDGALKTNGGWVSADSLSQMQLPYAVNKFYITSWGSENGQSEWADFTVSIGSTNSTFSLADQTFNANTAISFDQLIDTSNLDPGAYLRIYDVMESKYLDASGDGWIHSNELSNYSFSTGPGGSAHQIWVDTFLSGNGRSGWENFEVKAIQSNDQSLTIADFAGVYDLKGFSTNPMCGNVPENDVESYDGSCEIKENGDYSFFAEVTYQSKYFWTSDQGYIQDVTGNTIYVNSLYDGDAQIDFDIQGEQFIATLGEGYSGDECVQTYKFEMTEDYNSSENFQNSQKAVSELKPLGINESSEQNIHFDT